MSTSKLPIKLHHVNVNVYWKQDTNSNKCELCHGHIMSASQDEIANQRISGEIVIGKCGCGFHADCFEAWKKSGNKLCPVDSSTWNSDGKTSNTVVWDTIRDTRT